ncbi:hypothetical protein V8C86DRAFT_1242327 [Haematococcus lacustris]
MGTRGAKLNHKVTPVQTHCHRRIALFSHIISLCMQAMLRRNKLCYLCYQVLMLGGAAVFGLYSQHEPVDFDALDNSPFAIERQLQRAWQGSGAAGVMAGAQASLAPSWANMQRMREGAARQLSRWGASGQAVGARLVAKLGLPAGDGGEGGVEAPGGQQQAAGRATEPRAQPASQTVRKSQWGQLGGSRAARRQGNSADSGSKGDRQ